MARQMCTFKLEDKSVRLNGRTKVYALNGKTKVYV